MSLAQIEPAEVVYNSPYAMWATIAVSLATVVVTWLRTRAHDSTRTGLPSDLAVLLGALDEIKKILERGVSCVAVPADKIEELIRCAHDIQQRVIASNGAILDERDGVDDVLRELSNLSSLLENCRQCQAMKPEERAALISGLGKIVSEDRLKWLIARHGAE